MNVYEWSFHTIFSCQQVDRVSSERFSFSCFRTKIRSTLRSSPLLIYLRPHAERISEIMQKSESNGKIPTLKNGTFNRGRSSTLYEYVKPRNVTEFISPTTKFLTTDSRWKVKSAALRLLRAELKLVDHETYHRSDYYTACAWLV